MKEEGGNEFEKYNEVKSARKVCGVEGEQRDGDEEEMCRLHDC